MKTKKRMKAFLRTMTVTMMTILLMSLTLLFTKNNLLLYLTKTLSSQQFIYVLINLAKRYRRNTDQSKTLAKVPTHQSLIFHRVCA